MTPDPLLVAWARQRANRRRAEGVLPIVVRVLAALVSVAILVPFVDEVFLRWLAAPSKFWPDALEALLLRLDIVLIGLVSLETYTALIRGGDRRVLAIWPVDPKQVVRFEMLRMLSRWWWLVPALAVVVGRIALVDPMLWALVVAQLAVTFMLALSASALVVLWAVDAAHSPRWRPLLDMVRGNNHPAQAAFLYAPAVVLLGAGALVQGAATGAAWVYQGNAAGLLLFVLPMVATVLAWLPVSGLASRNWFRAGQVMAEVDARYAALETPEDALRVYLDWFVRFLPPQIARYTLLDLRHGWRVRRTWVMGAWLAGLASLVAAWTADPSGPGRSAAIGALGAWLLGGVAMVLRNGEPDFLRHILPEPTAAKLIGRALAVFLWLQPVVWLGALAAWIRQGTASFVLVLAVAGTSAVAAAIAGSLCARRGGLPLYGPIAALASLLAVQVGVQ